MSTPMKLYKTSAACSCSGPCTCDSGLGATEGLNAANLLHANKGAQNKGGALEKTTDHKHQPAHKPPHTVAPTPDDHYQVDVTKHVKKAELDDLHWRVLHAVYGEKNAHYLHSAPLNVLVRNKIAKDFPDQNTSADFRIPDVIGHLAEKYAEARRRWSAVEEGIASIKYLESQGLLEKRARLLPMGCLERKQLHRGMYKLAEDSAPDELRPRLTALREEYDRQFEEWLGPEHDKTAAAGKGLVDTMKGLYSSAMDNPLASTALKGLAGGTAVAVPGIGAGKMLLSDAEERARSAAAPLALSQAAGGLVGGIGGGIGGGLARKFIGGE